jgi:hypothetical protein
MKFPFIFTALFAFLDDEDCFRKNPHTYVGQNIHASLKFVVILHKKYVHPYSVVCGYLLMTK